MHSISGAFIFMKQNDASRDSNETKNNPPLQPGTNQAATKSTDRQSLRTEAYKMTYAPCGFLVSECTLIDMSRGSQLVMKKKVMFLFSLRQITA